MVSHRDYVEFQTAVLRALPQDIDSTVVSGWMQNDELLAHILRDDVFTRIFPVKNEGSYKTSELVARGRYDWWNGWITDERFPIRPHEAATRINELMKFNYGFVSERKVVARVLADFTCRGLQRPAYEDALYFGIQYPEEQKKHSIVFLHEPIRGPRGRHCVLALRGNSHRRDLSLIGLFDGELDRGCVFAAIR